MCPILLQSFGHGAVCGPGGGTKIQELCLHPPLLLVPHWRPLQVLSGPAPAGRALPAPRALSPGLGLLSSILNVLQELQRDQTLEICRQILRLWGRPPGSGQEQLQPANCAGGHQPARPGWRVLAGRQGERGGGGHLGLAQRVCVDRGQNSGGR